jgi:hypothetical protein
VGPGRHLGFQQIPNKLVVRVKHTGCDQILARQAVPDARVLEKGIGGARAKGKLKRETGVIPDGGDAAGGQGFDRQDGDVILKFHESMPPRDLSQEGSHILL